MKKSAIVIISIVILLLLAFRAVYIHFGNAKDEKLSYVHKLNFKFSARIDSVRLFNQRDIGLIYFHDPIGTFGSSEDWLQEQLEFNGDLRFILPHPNKDILMIFSKTADKYKAGDSIAVDTNHNKIAVYKGNKVIFEDKVTHVLNGRPF